MNKKINLISLVLLAFVFFAGCSKDLDEYNKPALYWYGKMIQSVADGNLEKADNYYSSLQGEHIGSPLLPEATMILAIAHMHYGEYLLSEHFLNEYTKRYANINQKEEADFLKIKAKYMALPNPRRDQALINDAIIAANKFKMQYPNSMYYEIVDTMLTRLYLAQAALNETIASLYDRLDKPKSAAYYRSIKPQPWIKWDEIDRANTPWYRAWFEGDGTSSWYAFLIPDTRSVVSRNSVQDVETAPLSLPQTPKETQPIQKMQTSQSPLTTKEIQKEKQDFLKQDSVEQNQLNELRGLRQDGAITQEEYEMLKNEILQNKRWK